MSQEEIKLGWYRCSFGHDHTKLFNVINIVNELDNPVVGYWQGSTRVAQYAVEYFESICATYVGTELGEWVSPEDVKLSELPFLRARFRNDQESWKEGVLDGCFVCPVDGVEYARLNDCWYKQCQVWKEKKA
jgi:hypothetical protein